MLGPKKRLYHISWDGTSLPPSLGPQGKIEKIFLSLGTLSGIDNAHIFHFSDCSDGYWLNSQPFKLRFI